MLVLDTCVIIFDALSPERLSKRARQALDDGQAEATLSCADISLWEIAMLIEHGRLEPGVSADQFIQLALSARIVDVLPITADIAARSAALALHGDPADRLISATALSNGGRVVTSDKRLRRSRLVPTLW